MSTQKFNHTWIERLPYSSKRKLYIDSTSNTKFTNCDFVLMVGARSKTAYLRYRPIEKTEKENRFLKRLGMQMSFYYLIYAIHISNKLQIF